MRKQGEVSNYPKKRGNVVEYHRSLLLILRKHKQHPSLAKIQTVAIVNEGGQIAGQRRNRLALSTSPADDGPKFLDTPAGLTIATAGELGEDGTLFARQRLAHGRDEQGPPGRPRVAGQDVPEQGRVIQRNSHRKTRSHFPGSLL